MPTTSVEIPDNLKKQIEEKVESGEYTSNSDLIRYAVRRLLEKENGLTPTEEEEVLQRIKDLKEGNKETIPLSEV